MTHGSLYHMLAISACIFCPLLVGCGIAVDPAYSQVYERVPLDGDRIELRFVKRGPPRGPEHLDEVQLRIDDETWYVRLAFAGKQCAGVDKPGEYRVIHALGPRTVSEHHVRPVAIARHRGLGRYYYFEPLTDDPEGSGSRDAALHEKEQ